MMLVAMVDGGGDGMV